MGSYVSLFEKTEEQKSAALSPTKSDYITDYADLTGLAVVEVQRFWYRFQQMGCDKNGMLSKKAIDKLDICQDAFVKNFLVRSAWPLKIIANLPREKDGSLNFAVFLNFVHWSESANEETKLRVIFNFLNNGKDLDEEILSRLLKRVYTTSTQNEIKEVTRTLMTQLDPKGTGLINENQFVNSIRSDYSDKQLSQLLRVDLIPGEVLDEINMQPSMAGSMMNLRNDKNMPLTVELTESLIESIASKAIKKDWEKLAIKLGFLEFDIVSLKQKNNNKAYETLVEILTQWRDQDPFLATKSRLRRYLEDSSMFDASRLLD